MRTDRVLLVGMMGSGKTSVGRELAADAGWPFVDNDDLVVQATGRTPRELLEAGGEGAMRAAESEALGAALELDPPVVATVAAGTVLDPADRDRLRGAGTIVWLDAPPDVLARRAAGGAHRPWLDGDPVAWFRREHALRSPLYAEVAELRVDTSRRSVAQVAEAIRAERFPDAPGT